MATTQGFEKFRSLALCDERSGWRLRRERSGWRLRVVGLAVLVMTASGCGNALYAISANSASTKVEEARELGAEQYATYDFYLATEHLQKAQTEASEADYSDAANLAEQAEEHADKAIRLAREAHRGAGR